MAIVLHEVCIDDFDINNNKSDIYYYAKIHNIIEQELDEAKKNFKKFLDEEYGLTINDHDFKIKRVNDLLTLQVELEKDMFSN